MSGLWAQILENLSFILCCVAIVVGLALLAKLAERFMPEMRKVSKARYVSIVGICAAIATVLHMLDFPLLFLAPDFYKVDFSVCPCCCAVSIWVPRQQLPVRESKSS